MSEKGTDRIANILTARAAILDFYSDRAGSFTSFFVASIFGLVTLLAIVQGTHREVAHNNPLYYGVLIVISIVIYIAFAYAGRHTFERFAHYADIADKLVMYPIADKVENETIQKSLMDIAELEKLKFETQLECTTNLRKYILRKSKIQDRLFEKKVLSQHFDLLYLVLLGLLGALVYLPKIVDILLLVFPCLAC